MADERIDAWTESAVAATGDEVALGLTWTVNKATSGDDTAISINKVDTASPGVSRFVNLLLGGTSQFQISEFGSMFQVEKAAADADIANYGQWWVQTATPNLAMFTDDAGNDRTLAHDATTTLSSLVTVGALDSGSITSGFGSIDIGASALSTTGTITGPSGTWDVGGMDLAAADTYAIAGTDVLTATVLGSGVLASSLTSVGVLASPVLTTPQINDTSADHQYVFAVNELVADRTVTLPLLTGNDTFTFNAFAATLTNKAIDLTDNTVTGTAAEFNTAVSDDTIAFFGAANTFTGVNDFGGTTSLEVPNSATPTVNTDGEIAVDTTVADFSLSVMKFFGGEEQGVVSMPIAEFTTPADGTLVAYNATNDEFELVAPSGGGNVSNTGTPLDNQIPVWTSSTVIEGTADFTFDGADFLFYNAVNDGNPEYRLGATDAEEFHLQTVFDTGAQTLDFVLFQTDAASATADKGEYRFNVDGTEIAHINDSGINVLSGLSYRVNDTDVLTGTVLGTGVVTSSLTTVGALGSGSISSGFGNIDIGASTLSATGTITGPSGTWDAGGMDIATSDSYAINATDVLTATVLGSGVLASSLTSVGTLAGLIATGNIDFSGASEMKVPVSATPTVNADGELALDTTVTDFSLSVMKFFGGEEQGIISMPIAEFTTPTGGNVVAYNATNDEFELVAASGGLSNAQDGAAQELEVGIVDTALTNTIATNLEIFHTTSGTPAAGIGVGLDLIVETAAGNNEIGAQFQAVTTDVTATTEDIDAVFNAMHAGSLIEVGRFVTGQSDGNSYLDLPVRFNSNAVAIGTSANTGLGISTNSINISLGGTGAMTFVQTSGTSFPAAGSIVGSSGMMGWGNNSASVLATDINAAFFSDAVGEVVMRDDTNGDQAFFLSPERASSTDFQRSGVKTSTIIRATASGASVVTSGLVPAGKILLAISCRVDTTVTGATTFDVGDGTDVDRYGAAILLPAGTIVIDQDYTADPYQFSTSAQEVTLTANGANFTGGSVTIVAYYRSTEAD